MTLPVRRRKAIAVGLAVVCTPVVLALLVSLVLKAGAGSKGRDQLDQWPAWPELDNTALDRISCGDTPVGCPAALRRYMQTDPSRRIGPIIPIELTPTATEQDVGTRALLIRFTTKDAPWPRASELEVVEVECGGDAEGCAQRAKTLGANRIWQLAAISEVSEGIPRTSKLLVLQTRTSMEVSARDVRTHWIRCELTPDQSHMDGVAPNGGTDYGPGYCLRALEYHFRANPDERVFSILPVEGPARKFDSQFEASWPAGTQAMLVFSTSEAPWPRASKLWRMTEACFGTPDSNIDSPDCATVPQILAGDKITPRQQIYLWIPIVEEGHVFEGSEGAPRLVRRYRVTRRLLMLGQGERLLGP